MTPDIVKLRELTGAGVMDCKRALSEAGGDMEKAKAFIMERGVAIAEKKAGRKTGAGILESYVHNNRVGVLLELRCETDFVVHSDPFKQLAHDLVMHIAAMDPQTPDELLKQVFIKDPNLTIGQLVKGVIAKVGENIEVARFVRYEL